MTEQKHVPQAGDAGSREEGARPAMATLGKVKAAAGIGIAALAVTATGVFAWKRFQGLVADLTATSDELEVRNACLEAENNYLKEENDYLKSSYGASENLRRFGYR
ncbi:hypothetical protein ABZT04_43080 [Streptomyces sp. NPDC005492]|uniref:hypothetical protein n=1 Tax=Streptomyces sp. NPDC005492 TaxID=3156883 RepID=UPI0033BC4608